MARESLTGGWKIAILGAILYSALIIVPATLFKALLGDWVWRTNFIINLYTLIVTGPITLGFVNFSFALFRNREGGVGTVLSGFSSFFKSFGLFIVMNVFIFLWSLLLVIPGIIAAYRYSMAFFVMADKPDTGVLEALRESKRIMKGNKFKLFRLQFSFIGWVFLVFAVYFDLILLTAFLGLDSGTLVLIAMLLAIPVYASILIYIQVAVTAFYELACGNRRHDAIDADFTTNKSHRNSADEEKKVFAKDSAEGRYNPLEEKKE
jgi:uncharacterized membrane protein